MSDINLHLEGFLMYDAMYIVGIILMVLLNVFQFYKIGNITRSRAAVYTLVSGAYGLLGAILSSNLFTVITNLKGINYQTKRDLVGGVLFMLIGVPATVYIENYFRKRKIKPNLNIDAKRVKIKTANLNDILDSIAPGATIFLVFTKFACAFGGCCYGVECSWGVYSWSMDTTLFPVQLCEAATNGLILIAVYYIAQTKFYRRGMAIPLTGAMYVFSRFCWEFLRGYTPEMRHFFLGLSLWQIFCLVILIVPIVWIIVLYKTQPSEPMPKNYLFAKSGKKNVNSKGK